MNCIFCQKTLEKVSPTDGWHGEYTCFECHPDWTVRIATLPNSNDIDYFYICNKEFYVEQCPELNSTRIFKWKNSQIKASPEGTYWTLFMTLDSLPTISPATMQHWLDRILNLKAFY